MIKHAFAPNFFTIGEAMKQESPYVIIYTDVE